MIIRGCYQLHLNLIHDLPDESNNFVLRAMGKYQSNVGIESEIRVRADFSYEGTVGVILVRQKQASHLPSYSLCGFQDRRIFILNLLDSKIQERFSGQLEGFFV